MFKSAASPGYSVKSRGAEGKGRWRSLGRPLRGDHVLLHKCPCFPLNSCTPCQIRCFRVSEKQNKTKKQNSLSPSRYGAIWRGTFSLLELSCRQDLSKRQTFAPTFALTRYSFLTPLLVTFSCSLLFIKAQIRSTERKLVRSGDLIVKAKWK